MYALAAGAAGVSLVALSHPSEAKIVYTPAHVKLAPNESYGIDFDHNGTPDFYLDRLNRTSNSEVYASGHPTWGNGNAVAAARTHNAFALAIFPGARIGPARNFVETNTYFPPMAVGFSSGTKVKWSGPWANGGRGVRNRYLGVKFHSGGKFHYGWARVTITIDNPKVRHFSSVVLTGYAYETIPNKPIIAGKTKGPDDSAKQPTPMSLTAPAPKSVTLGALALGASGLSTWRREESVAATPEGN
jgi:hypothetical protein